MDVFLFIAFVLLVLFAMSGLGSDNRRRGRYDSYRRSYRHDDYFDDDLPPPRRPWGYDNRYPEPYRGRHPDEDPYYDQYYDRRYRRRQYDDREYWPENEGSPLRRLAVTVMVTILVFTFVAVWALGKMGLILAPSNTKQNQRPVEMGIYNPPPQNRPVYETKPAEIYLHDKFKYVAIHDTRDVLWASEMQENYPERHYAILQHCDNRYSLCVFYNRLEDADKDQELYELRALNDINGLKVPVIWESQALPGNFIWDEHEKLWHCTGE